MLPGILVRAPRVPVPTGTHGKSPLLTDKSSLSVHRSDSHLVPRDSPAICKAEVEHGDMGFPSSQPNTRWPPLAAIGFGMIQKGGMTVVVSKAALTVTSASET